MLRAMVQRSFGSVAGGYECYETTGTEKVHEIVRAAVERGFGLVVAAGGDGTVSQVASGLLNTTVPMGILPTGTANVLAQELGIPLDLQAACDLLTGEYTLVNIDGMQVANQSFFLQIGIGLDAIVMRDTQRRAKRIFGRLAYIATGLTRLVGYQPRRFTIVVDGRRHRPRAAQVIIANGGTFGFPYLRWGPDILFDDGIINVCVVYARAVTDYGRILWHMVRRQPKRSRKIRYFAAQHSIIVNADDPLPVQADGEVIGETPTHINVIRSAVRVIVPIGAAPPGLSNTATEKEETGATI